MGISDMSKAIRFHMIKSGAFRVIHADGAFGGPTPRGNLMFTLYSERVPFPQRISHELTSTPEGELRLGDEIVADRISKDGVVRELECGVVMDIAGVRSLHAWLGAKIKEMDGKPDADGNQDG